MPIREEIEFKWGEESHKLIVDMSLIANIENNFNLTSFVSDVSRDQIKSSHAAIFAAKLLQAAGAKVDIDDCYIAFIGGDTIKKRDQVATIITTGLNAMFPVSKKKSSAVPAKKKAARRKA